MILCDYHNHTHFSADCDTPAEQMIEGAIRASLTHLCITDHMDPDMQFPGLDFTFDLDEYFAKHRMWKEKYKDQINLLTGIELGLQPHIGDDLRQIIAAGPYDFAIGSIHVVDRIDPYFKEYWDGKTEFEGTYRYFENVLDLVLIHKNSS